MCTPKCVCRINVGLSDLPKQSLQVVLAVQHYVSMGHKAPQEWLEVEANKLLRNLVARLSVRGAHEERTQLAACLSKMVMLSDVTSMTPLFQAAFRRHEHLVDTLLVAGVCVHQGLLHSRRGKDGALTKTTWTPLSARCHPSVQQRLLAAGANPYRTRVGPEVSAFHGYIYGADWLALCVPGSVFRQWSRWHYRAPRGRWLAVTTAAASPAPAPTRRVSCGGPWCATAAKEWTRPATAARAPGGPRRPAAWTVLDPRR